MATGSAPLPPRTHTSGNITASFPGCALRRCKLIPADIYFLADNTGSMGDVINAVKSGAGQILTSLTSSINDLYTGGGAYRDRFSGFMFGNTASVAGGTGGAQSAINAWSAANGGDEPEGQLYALYQARIFLLPAAFRPFPFACCC